MKPQAEDVTVLLHAWRAGDTNAGDRLMSLVYQDLRRIAANHLRSERSDHTLQATALVNELYLELFADGVPDLENRAHFFAVAARQLRRILIDHARKRQAQKRAGVQVELRMDEAAASAVPDDKLLLVDELLDEMEGLDARAARVVELKFFGGLTDQEAAAATGTSVSSVRRDWDFARSWLLMRMGGGRNVE